jgi:drug/metabolite transporter (DMT)-like permease
MTQGPARERRAVGAMVLACLLWGGTFVAIRDTVAAIPPVLLVASRFALAGVAFALVLAVRRRAPRRPDLAGGVLSGLLMAGAFTLQAEGLRSTSAGSSAFLTCAGSLLTAFWAWLLLRQRPGARLLAGIAVAMTGSALLSLERGLALGRGEALTLAGAALFALQIVAVARFAREVEPVALVCVHSFVAAAVLAPFAGPPAALFAALEGANLWRFLYLALAGSTLAPLLQVSAQRTLSAGRIGLLFALEPVFALLFALTLGAESFAPRWWLGAALILGAVMLVEWRPARGSLTSPATPPATG